MATGKGAAFFFERPVPAKLARSRLRVFWLLFVYVPPPASRGEDTPRLGNEKTPLPSYRGSHASVASLRQFCPFVHFVVTFRPRSTLSYIEEMILHKTRKVRTMAGKQVEFGYNGKVRIGTVIIDAADYIKVDCGNGDFRNFTKSKIVGLTIKL